MTDPWPAPSAHHITTPLDAVVRLPGSKSLTNRFLVLAALAEEESRLRAPLRSRDTLLMAEGLRVLGAQITDLPGEDAGLDDWLIRPGTVRGGGTIECGLAGTVMRFLPAVAALANGPVHFDGDAGARTRPMGPVVDSLRELGVAVDSAGGFLPVTVHAAGTPRGGRVEVDASASSQFVSAMLLVGARLREGLDLIHTGDRLPSRPHIEMTVEVLRDAGVVIDDEEPGRWVVEPGTIHPVDVTVEPDLTNAAPFLGAALALGGTVRIPDWPSHTSQAGDAIREILTRMGAQVSLDRDGVTVTGQGRFTGADLDLADAGELAPTVAALAALAESPSRLRGIAHLRGHETDRLAALAAEINRLGGAARETPDGLEITPRPLHGEKVRTYADHRMATTAALLGLRAPGTTVENVATTAKTLPDFPGMWTRMLGLPAGSPAEG